jgi:ATP-binding cassette subfamily F protein uup
LETTLAAPDFYATRAKEAPALIKELEDAKAEVSRLYARWEELDKIGK